jgi:ATP-binding cassette subfamily F protein uup
MLAQRGQDLKDAMRAPAKPVVTKASKAPASEVKPGKRRLSFHEKHALDTLPKTIDSLTAKARALHARLDDPGLYARDRAAFDDVSAALVSVESELAAAEEKWLELEILRDAIDGD